jgi:phospholipid/cholesterol/gamma-HCH transport system substrate-binding protein
MVLRAYFENAAGLKDGAPVTLEGVTIGNVIHVRVVPSRNPTPVQVTMRVGHEFLPDLHTDSTASIAQAGVLGDSFIDIDSTHATGPPPANNAELKTSESPTIQDVIQGSQVSIAEINTLMRKVESLVDTLNSQRGTVGELINDPSLAQKITHIATNLQTITGAISDGKGSLGKLVNDDTLYTHANSAVERLDRITTDLDEGKGSAGKLLQDDALYDNLNDTVSNANQLIAQINSGKGALGMMAKDPAFAKKLDDTVSQLDSILKSVDEGNGTLGQLVQNRALYDHADQSLEQAQQLVKSIREDPKKYLVIHMKIF